MACFRMIALRVQHVGGEKVTNGFLQFDRIISSIACVLSLVEQVGIVRKGS